MKKQPYLTNFPKYILATAKRKRQALIAQVREQIKKDKLSGYAVLFEEVLPASFLRSLDKTKRQRHYGHIAIFWAWIAQVLELNSSCSRGVSFLQSWYSSQGLPVPYGGTSAYCKARQRLPQTLLETVFKRVNQELSKTIQAEDLWCGLELKAIDGTNFSLMDTAENQGTYPQPTGQKEGCGFPSMGAIGLVNLSHGGIESLITTAWSTGEVKVATQLLKHLSEKDLLMADRAYCSYEYITRITTQRKGNILMRLHHARHKCLQWTEQETINENECLVTWTKPQQPKNSDLSKQQWEALAPTLKLRLIKMHYQARCGTVKELIVVTNLLDHHKYQGKELINLYARRWEIEVKFRDIKTTMGLEIIAVKSPQMAHKTLYIMMIAYNLIRYLMKQASQQIGEPSHHMSYKASLDLISSSQDNFKQVRGQPIKRQKLKEELLELLTSKTLNIRPHRRQPRTIKRRPKPYQLLNKPRHEFKEIPHRGKYRKQA